MRILTLIIKKVHFDNIINGTKTKETREIRLNSFKKYYQFDEKGELVGLRPYDAIQFYVGYNPGREQALVAVTGSELILLVDEHDKPLTYIGPDGQEYAYTNAEYSLGNVL